MEDILNIDTGDDIAYKIIDIKDIRQESEYEGFKLNILATMQTLRVYLAIELTTGDKITPREIEYNYNSLFENKKIPILAYNVETVIAEKFQAIIDRDIYNTRMKDFYDIYVLIEEKKEIIDTKNLIQAIENTFKKRNTSLNASNIKEQLKSLKTSERLKTLWMQYQIDAPYSNNISFEELFKSLLYITTLLINQEI